MGNIRMGWPVFIVITVGVFAVIAKQFYMHHGVDISQKQLLEHIEKKSNIYILDVRSAREYKSGHVPGAVNIGHTDVSARLDELESYKSGDVVVYCEMGVRARMAQNILTKAGFERVYHLTGDMAGWRNANLPMQISDASAVE